MQDDFQADLTTSPPCISALFSVRRHRRSVTMLHRFDSKPVESTAHCPYDWNPLYAPSNISAPPLGSSLDMALGSRDWALGLAPKHKKRFPIDSGTDPGMCIPFYA